MQFQPTSSAKGLTAEGRHTHKSGRCVNTYLCFYFVIMNDVAVVKCGQLQNEIKIIKNIYNY